MSDTSNDSNFTVDKQKDGSFKITFKNLQGGINTCILRSAEQMKEVLAYITHQKDRMLKLQRKKEPDKK